MDIFGISDLHLPGGEDKPMDVFGTNGRGTQSACHRLERLVAPDDLVLVPGDLSWAMKLPAVRRSDFLGTSPVPLYWSRKSRSVVEEHQPAPAAASGKRLALQMISISCRDSWRSAAPGVEVTGAADFTPMMRIYRRELERLRLPSDCPDRGAAIL